MTRNSDVTEAVLDFRSLLHWLMHDKTYPQANMSISEENKYSFFLDLSQNKQEFLTFGNAFIEVYGTSHFLSCISDSSQAQILFTSTSSIGFAYFIALETDSVFSVAKLIFL
jgi:hypothetical protein